MHSTHKHICPQTHTHTHTYTKTHTLTYTHKHTQYDAVRVYFFAVWHVCPTLPTCCPFGTLSFGVWMLSGGSDSTHYNGADNMLSFSPSNRLTTLIWVIWRHYRELRGKVRHQHRHMFQNGKPLKSAELLSASHPIRLNLAILKNNP